MSIDLICGKCSRDLKVETSILTQDNGVCMHVAPCSCANESFDNIRFERDELKKELTALRDNIRTMVDGMLKKDNK